MRKVSSTSRRGFLKIATSLVATAAIGGDFNASHPALSRMKLGATSDGFSEDFEEALRLMKSHGLSWVEIRSLWGKYNTEATPEQIRSVKELMKKYEFRCSVVDSALYKCVLPGTKDGGERDPYPYSGQMDLLKRAMDRAHAWGTDKVSGFTFWRVSESEKIYPRIGEELARAAEVAKGGGIRLAIENEESCNGGTGHEVAAILKMVPASNIGFTWDVGNGYWNREVSYPDGYNSLDKSRIWNVHLKGIQCDSGMSNCRESFVDDSQIDLLGQLKALVRDHYHETMSLECEFKAPGLSHQQTTQRSMEGLLRIADKAVKETAGRM
ncbi:MAG: sugar phosphate isomerase/epimerase family protein [Terriglobia bacterium]|jgi:sugar phosphate isomerase/epimerase